MLDRGVSLLAGGRHSAESRRIPREFPVGRSHGVVLESKKTLGSNGNCMRGGARTLPPARLLLAQCVPFLTSCMSCDTIVAPQWRYTWTHISGCVVTEPEFTSFFFFFFPFFRTARKRLLQRSYFVVSYGICYSVARMPRLRGDSPQSSYARTNADPAPVVPIFSPASPFPPQPSKTPAKTPLHLEIPADNSALNGRRKKPCSASTANQATREILVRINDRAEVVCTKTTKQSRLCTMN